VQFEGEGRTPTGAPPRPQSASSLSLGLFLDTSRQQE